MTVAKMSIVEEKLFSAAQSALKFSYAPYSQFNVACAVLTKNGKIYTGCNVENASYGGTICAERVAINKAVSEGHQKFTTILVMTKQDYPVFPCGLCGQTILEFCPQNTTILIANNKKIFKKLKLKDLFPFSFTRDQLVEK